MSATDGFQFTDERPRETANSLVVVVPGNLKRKRRLLAVYAGRLQFPDYFGWNWDAFEECLGDLSWLSGVHDVIVVHRDIPFAEAAQQRATYLTILLARMQQSQQPRLSVIFPPHCRQPVMHSLASD